MLKNCNFLEIFTDNIIDIFGYYLPNNCAIAPFPLRSRPYSHRYFCKICNRLKSNECKGCRLGNGFGNGESQYAYKSIGYAIFWFPKKLRSRERSREYAYKSIGYGSRSRERSRQNMPINQ